jgi:hypothetical protein
MVGRRLFRRRRERLRDDFDLSPVDCALGQRWRRRTPDSGRECTNYVVRKMDGSTGGDQWRAIGRNRSHTSKSSHDAPQFRTGFRPMVNLLPDRGGPDASSYRVTSSSHLASSRCANSGIDARNLLPPSLRLCRGPDKRLPPSPAHEREVELFFWSRSVKPGRRIKKTHAVKLGNDNRARSRQARAKMPRATFRWL